MKTSILLVALTGGLAAVVACSSSSNTPTNDNNEGDGGSSSGASSSGASSSSSSSSGSSNPLGNLQLNCMSAAGCLDAGPGAICCLAGLSGTACQTSACTPLEGMSTQLCASSAECTNAPDTNCAPALIPGYTTCQPPAASTDAGSSGGGDAAPTDAAPTDAPTGG